MGGGGGPEVALSGARLGTASDNATASARS
jgi:hypothetical protein